MATFSLPLYELTPLKRRKSKKQGEIKVEKELPGPSKLYFNDVKPCTEEEAINLLKVKYQTP